MSEGNVRPSGLGSLSNPGLAGVRVLVGDGALARLFLLAAVYFAAGKLGLSFAYLNPSASPVWPPTGIALAALLILGYRAWPAILLGAFLVNWTTPMAPVTALAIATGNTLEGLGGAWLVNRWANGRHAYERPADIFKSAILAGMLAPSVSALVGVTSLCVGGLARWQGFGAIALTWWLGDAVGAVTVAPAVVLWINDHRTRWGPSRYLEGAALFATLLLITGVSFSKLSSSLLGAYPVNLLWIPVLLWAAFRYSPRGAALAILGWAAAAIIGTGHGLGPFVRGTVNESLLFEQGFVGLASVMTLAVSASVSERKRYEQAAAHLAAIVASSSDAIVGKTANGMILSWNSAAERMFGYTAAEAIGAPISMLAPPDRADEMPQILERLKRGETLQSFETERQRKDGVILNVSLTISPVRDARGKMIGASTIARDISERKLAEIVLEETNERLRESVHDLERQTREIASLNEMTHLLQSCQNEEEANAVIQQFAERLFPDESGALYIQSASTDSLETARVWGLAPPVERVFSPRDCWALRRGQVHATATAQSALVCPHLSQEPALVDALCVPMTAQGRAVGLLHLRGARWQESARRRAARESLAASLAGHAALALVNLKLQDTLRVQSTRDPLTGLFNRRYMKDCLERELRRAARGQHGVAVIMLDLDFFKEFNDSHGHEAGDTLLRELAAFLQKHTRREDFPCRYGGDEFLIILTETTAEAAERRAQELRDGTRCLIVPFGERYLNPSTVSVGVALYPEHGNAAETLLRAADQALYKAKSAGRDRICVASDQTGEQATPAPQVKATNRKT